MSDGVDVVVTLHALATYAESANHWTDDKRMMDASGVADTIYEAMDRIEELEANLAEQIEWVKCLADDLIAAEGRAERAEAKLAKVISLADAMAEAIEDQISLVKSMAMDCLVAKGQAADAYQAQLKAEAKLSKAVEALFEAIYLLDPDEEDIAKGAGLYRIVTTFKELKGENDE